MATSNFIHFGQEKYLYLFEGGENEYIISKEKADKIVEEIERRYKDVTVYDSNSNLCIDEEQIDDDSLRYRPIEIFYEVDFKDIDYPLVIGIRYGYYNGFNLGFAFLKPEYNYEVHKTFYKILDLSDEYYENESLYDEAISGVMEFIERHSDDFPEITNKIIKLIKELEDKYDNKKHNELYKLFEELEKEVNIYSWELQSIEDLENYWENIKELNRVEEYIDDINKIFEEVLADRKYKLSGTASNGEAFYNKI